MAFSVKIEIQSATYDSSEGEVVVMVLASLINDKTSTVVATKNIDRVLKDTKGDFDSSDFLDGVMKDALMWGSFMLSVSKVSALTGKSKTVRLQD